MIIYTGLDGSLPETQDYEEMTVDVAPNVKLVMRLTGGQQGVVVRLLSTDPGDYLRPEFQPGQLISFGLSTSLTR